MKLESAQLLSEWNQMTGNCSKSGEGQNCILFHELYLQPFSVKMTIFWFFKVNHKGNRKEKKTNKPELGKQIPEQCERVPVSAGIVIRAKERHTVRVFASPQPTGKLVLYTQQLQTPPPGRWGHSCTFTPKDPVSFLYSGKFSSHVNMHMEHFPIYM